MEIKLSYQSIKQLVPFSKAFFNACIRPSKIWETLLTGYIIISLLFYSTFRSIINDQYLIFIYFCILILYSMQFVFAFIFFKKFENSILKIDLENENVMLPNKGMFQINKLKSMIINESDILLVINLNSSVKFGIPILSDSCDEESRLELINYLSE